MFSSIFTKTLYSLRWQILGWGLVIGLITFITISVYDSLAQSNFQEIVKSLPESLKGFIGSADNYTSINGFLAQQVFGLKVVMFAIAMAILFFMGISASEEDDGRLQTLASLPVSRTKIYFEKWLAVLVAIMAVTCCLTIATYFGLLLIGKTPDFQHLVESILSFWLITSCYGMVAYASSMLLGKKGLTTMIAGGYAIFGIIMTSLAASVENLKDVDKLSLLHYYNEPQIMQHGLNNEHTLLLLSVFVLLTIIGWIGFTRRSIGT